MKSFTDKEREVMELLCVGKTDAEIAMILHKHRGTVKQQVRFCLNKLDACNRTLAVAKYLAPDRFKR